MGVAFFVSVKTKTVLYIESPIMKFGTDIGVSLIPFIL